MKNFWTKRNIYIMLFALLYFCTALVSTIHAISFFCLANVTVLGVILAMTFEIGQAATLFSILTSKKDRSKFMPWALMFILTGVQILGNVFSSYKYLITNSAEQLRFFKEPIFVWMDLPDQQCNVILTYIIGAILPIVALCLTSMLTNYLEDNPSEDDVHKNETFTEHEQDKNYEQKEIIEDNLVQQNEMFNNNEQDTQNEQEVNLGIPQEEPIEEIVEEVAEPVIEEQVNLTEETPQEEKREENQEIKLAKKSHFINQ